MNDSPEKPERAFRAFADDGTPLYWVPTLEQQEAFRRLSEAINVLHIEERAGVNIPEMGMIPASPGITDGTVAHGAIMQTGHREGALLIVEDDMMRFRESGLNLERAYELIDGISLHEADHLRVSFIHNTRVIGSIGDLEEIKRHLQTAATIDIEQAFGSMQRFEGDLRDIQRISAKIDVLWPELQRYMATLPRIEGADNARALADRWSEHPEELRQLTQMLSGVTSDDLDRLAEFYERACSIPIRSPLLEHAIPADDLEIIIPARNINQDDYGTLHRAYEYHADEFAVTHCLSPLSRISSCLYAACSSKDNVFSGMS